MSRQRGMSYTGAGSHQRRPANQNMDFVGSGHQEAHIANFHRVLSGMEKNLAVLATGRGDIFDVPYDPDNPNCDRLISRSYLETRERIISEPRITKAQLGPTLENVIKGKYNVTRHFNLATFNEMVASAAWHAMLRVSAEAVAKARGLGATAAHGRQENLWTYYMLNVNDCIGKKANDGPRPYQLRMGVGIVPGLQNAHRATDTFMMPVDDEYEEYAQVPSVGNDTNWTSLSLDAGDSSSYTHNAATSLQTVMSASSGAHELPATSPLRDIILGSFGSHGEVTTEGRRKWFWLWWLQKRGLSVDHIDIINLMWKMARAMMRKVLYAICGEELTYILRAKDEAAYQLYYNQHKAGHRGAECTMCNAACRIWPNLTPEEMIIEIRSHLIDKNPIPDFGPEDSMRILQRRDGTTLEKWIMVHTMAHQLSLIHI